MFEKRFTVFLAERPVLEKRLAFLAAEDVLWSCTSRGERHVVLLSAAREAACGLVYDGLAADFGGLLVREGDTDFVFSLLDTLRGEKLTLVTAESCTGGLVSKLLSDAPGSSDVLWGAFVTYSNDAKMKILGVSGEILRTCGAVSEETVRAMTAGALAASGAGAAVAVSGVAGPGGGSAEKPVGTVWIGARLAAGEHAERLFHFSGPRERVRVLAAWTALFLLEGLVRSRDGSIDITLPVGYI
ncbi:MAG: nicotinamide-nucleotide amidohydrolase family protein [Spirochaetales bacterium]|nr:nicotinamide-nucleotide amidohydrolase family protein [Spirochaetales bacterium]